MRLNLGCGFNKLDGFVNVDKSPECEPDRVADLEEFPWPFDDDSADEVVMSHVLEHLGQLTETYLAIIQELYRICRDGAALRIRVPHPRHNDFINDPTHVRPIMPDQFHLFSRAKNLEWKEGGYANTPLALYLGVDFEVVSINMLPAEPFYSQLREGKLSKEELSRMALHQSNIIKEMDVELRCVKGD